MSPRGLNLLGDQARDSSQGLVVFPAIRHQRIKEQAKKIDEYSWEKDGYRLHPSSFEMNMCPSAHMRELAKGKFRFKVETLELMDDGTSKHVQMQELLLRIKDLLCDVPVPIIEDLDLLIRYLKIKPEIPFFWQGFSGRADLVYDYKGEVCVGDLKSTQQDASAAVDALKKIQKLLLKGQSTNEELQEIVKEALEASPKWKDNFLSMKRFTQLCSYPYLGERLGYWKKVGYVSFIVVNLSIPPSKGEREMELYYPWTDELREYTRLLFIHLRLARRAYLRKIDRECNYPLCKIHGEASFVKENIDRIVEIMREPLIAVNNR